MSDMPKEIYAAQDAGGSSYWLSAHHPAVDKKPHAKGRNQTKYIRADLKDNTEALEAVLRVGNVLLAYAGLEHKDENLKEIKNDLKTIRQALKGE